jgi:hypothetical protein
VCASVGMCGTGVLFVRQWECGILWQWVCGSGYVCHCGNVCAVVGVGGTVLVAMGACGGVTPGVVVGGDGTAALCVR